MKISVNSTVIKNPNGKVKFKTFNEGGSEHFHIGIWVEGDDRDLDSIEKVQYKLHPSFKKYLRESAARSNNFSITIWTWGMFDIEVTISKKDGTEEMLKYYLEYSLPEDDGTNYVDISNS